MRIATWNVNSAKQRVPRLLPWLDERRPDVVCLQETKLTDDAFAELFAEPLAQRGYEFASHGQGQWNGVALLSRVGLDDVERGFPGMPGFPGPEARAISASCDGLRVHSLYVPNGREPDSDHYHYKLDWLAAAWIDRQARKGTGPSDHAPVIVDLDEAPDGDIGPVVPPPSAPRTPRRGTRKLPQSR